MSRSILAASRVHPIWQAGPIRVESPDEDAFTLSVGALSLLAPQFRPAGARRLHRLHLVGAYAAESDWAFSEALGIPHLEVRHHPLTSQGLWGALAAAAHDDAPAGREAVVTAEVAAAGREGRPERQAGAAGFLLGPEAGLAVLRHGYRGTTPGRGPSMKGAVLEWLEAVGVSAPGAGLEVVFGTDELAGRWQSVWEEVAPVAAVTSPWYAAEPATEASMLRAASGLWELARRLRTSQSGLIAEVHAGRIGYAGFRLDGPVRWRGQWGPLPPGEVLPTSTSSERKADLGALSQGAYVPHPRYLENLPSRWRLEAERCGHCDTLTFPIAGRCSVCGRSDGLRREPLARDGLEVQAVTTIASGAQPTEFDPVVAAAGSYDVLIAGLGASVRGTFQVTDAAPGQVRIGDRVRLALRRLYPMEGEWRYGLKAVPDRNPPAPSSTTRRRRPSEAPRGRRASLRGRGAATARRRPAAR